MTLEPRCALPVPADAVRLLLVQELLGRAIYCLGPIFPSRQHDGPVLAQVLPALDQIVGIVETAMREEDGLRQILHLEVPERTLLRRRYQGPSNG